MEASDQDLVARVQNGDKQAFRHLVERYSRSVFKLAFRMTRTEHDAEDVVQESFLRAYRQIHHYRSDSSFGTWIYRIASNHSLDLLRARQRHAVSTGKLPETASSAPSAERLVFAGEIRDGIEEAFETLSPQERAAFALRHYEGQSIDEIAEALELTETAAKNSIFRAVQKLRRHLEPLCITTRNS
jgi:RNA polymerase sigma-70 factor (ECF subfamily)